jgi:hypothetical protein
VINTTFPPTASIGAPAYLIDARQITVYAVAA